MPHSTGCPVPSGRARHAPPGRSAARWRAWSILAGTLAAACASAQLTHGPHSLDTDGYIRTGVGTSKGGATQADFQAPGALARYRLGNEANTYYELAADYRYHLGGAGAEEGGHLQAYYMGADFKPFEGGDELGLEITQQLYLRAADLWPGLAVWVGRRYYHRNDIHLNDYFWQNSGQGAEIGGGVEGLDLGAGRLSIAGFRFDDPAAGGTLKTEVVDLRVSDIATNDGGFLTLWGKWALRHGNDGAFDREDGFGLGLWHDQVDPLGITGSHTLALTYRRGAGVPQNGGTGAPIREDQGFDLEEAEVWELTNNLVIEPNRDFSMQWGLVLRAEDRGAGGAGGDSLRWFSTGVRPIYYLTDHLNLALELGLDHVDNEPLGVEGSLGKATLAFQIAKDRGYFSRPVLRFFGTYATWSRDFEGLVGTGPGDAPYGDETSGWTLGIQFESWW